MSKIKIKASDVIKRNRIPRKIYSADEFDDFNDFELDDEMNEEGMSDEIDKLQDSVEDLQDSVDEIDEDKVNIETDNNISDHLVAECESCKGIFISAMVESDQAVSSISGVCPLCNEETEQNIKWVIKDL